VATVEHPEGDVPTLEVVRRLLVQRAPPGFEVRNVQWSSYFRIHHRQVALLRVGRIFVAGDAAHIHSPFGGQGMNTGLQDVWNLVWKLDFAARGGGGDDFLDSYTTERRPVIKRVIKTTDLLTKVMGTQSKFGQALRNCVIPLVSRLAPFQRAFVLRLSQLGVAYRGSPIVEGSGERYFDDSMRGGSGIRSRYLLLIGRDSHPSTVAAVQQLCAPLSEIVEPRIAPRPGVTLVRPDGYVAYAAAGRDGSGEVASMRAALERARKWSR
jgi:hypothetical protein